MTLPTQPYKGARDFYPEDKRLQKYIFNVMRQTVERFGYEEYDAPILEPLDLYLAKSGEEIVSQQTYTFADRGDRQVAIRPEMTPSVARMVAARRQELGYPLRWYSLPNLWRYERPQRGRLREHWQLNVDLFGVSGLPGDHELIVIADQLMSAFGAKRDMYTIRLNSRQLMAAVMEHYLSLDETQAATLGKLIDRMPKIDYAAFVGEADLVFTPSQRDEGVSDKFFEFLKISDLSGLPTELRAQPACQGLAQLIELLQQSGITNVKFDPGLMRGFDYYTDIIFEVFDNHPDNNRSLFGGGRYDGLVGLFGVEPLSTVGFGMGDVTLQNFLESHGLAPQLRPATDAYVVLIGDVYTVAQPILANLRAMELNIAVDATGRKLDKQLKSATKMGIPYAIFIGPKEIEQQQYALKNLDSGQEETHSAERIVSIIKDFRQRP